MDINDVFMPEEVKETQHSADKKSKVIYGGPLFDGKGEVFQNGCVYISGKKIIDAGREEDVFPQIPKNKKELELIDTQGKVIFPAMINAHQHFFSAYTRGLTPKGEFTTPEEKLNKLWWPLDKALDEESLQIAALISIMESIETGVTTIFDLHSSPSCIKGSLEIIAAAVKKAGINAVLSHEISDRNGKAKFQEALEENLDFIDKYDEFDNIRGSLGLHANFTLSENSMKKIAQHFDPDVGIHIHCGETPADMNFSRDTGYKGCVHRLAEHNLLSDKAILAHGLYLSDTDLNILEKTKALLVYNPESNANNHLKNMPLNNSKRIKIGLGSDGLNSNMLQSLRSAFLLQRSKGIKESVLYKKLPNFLFEQNVAFAQRLFDRKIGVIEKGATADVVIFDYVPFTPFHENNIRRHLLFGMHDKKADTVISQGKIIYKDKVLLSLDRDLILEQAKEMAQKVWENYL